MAAEAPQDSAELAKLLQQWGRIVNPAPPIPPKEPKEFNGAQMDAILKLVRYVQDGRQTYDQAMIALTIGFDLDISDEQARRILGPRPLLRHKPQRSERAIVVMSSHSPIQGGQWCQICMRPQSGPFLGQRIIIPDDIAPYFEIVDIRVGNRSQFRQQTSPHSAMLYAARVSSGPKISVGEHKIQIDEDAVAECGREFPMDTVQAAMDLSFDVRLKDHAPPTIFEVMILGIRGL